MPAAVIGGNVRYPNLQSIADLFRAQINDDFEGATNTPGEGLIAYNTAPFLLTFMNSAIRDVYSDLRNVGDPALILDNYILFGLPALTAPNPAVQVSLSYAGFFDGYQWHPQWTLPISCTKVERLWERYSNGSSGSSGSSSTTTPLYFRVRCAITSGTVSIALSSEPAGDSTSLTATGTEIALVSLADQTEVDVAVSGDDPAWTGTVYFEASADGNTWYSTPPGSTTEQDFSTILSLPLPQVPAGSGLIPASASSAPNGFVPMTVAPFGLPPCQQVERMGLWELRQNAIWMPGALNQIDLRIRCRITFPDFLNPDTIDFSTAYVPIVDCQNAVVAKMMILYAKRFAPEQYQLAIADETRLMDKLKLETVRQLQNTEYQRAQYGDDATASYGWLAQL